MPFNCTHVTGEKRAAILGRGVTFDHSPHSSLADIAKYTKTIERDSNRNDYGLELVIESKIEKKEFLKSVIVAGVFSVLALIAWKFSESFSLGDCIDVSDESYQNPNTGASIRIYVISCALASTSTKIELTKSSESEPEQIFNYIGASDLTANWYYLDHVIISGTLSGASDIDLQITRFDGLKIDYEFVEE